MHGTGNLAASLVFPLADVAGLFVFSAIGFAIVAIPLVLASWSRWISIGSRDPDAQSGAVADAPPA
jgi:hypothetical protein